MRVGVEGDRMDVLLSEMQKEGGEGEGELAACTVAGEDDVGGRDGGVQSVGRWRGEVEVCGEGVEEGAWERVLRRETVAQRKDAATGFAGERGCYLPMADLAMLVFFQQNHVLGFVFGTVRFCSY